MLKKYPFYFKSTIIIFGLILVIFIMHTLQNVLVPLGFAMLLSILLNPLVLKLEKRKIPRTVAIILSITSAVLVIAGIAYLIAHELGNLTDQLPLFKKKLADMFTKFQREAGAYFGISRPKQQEYIETASDSLKPIIGTAAGGILEMIVKSVLIPVYTFLLLFYKTLLLNFLYEVFAKADEKDISEVLVQTKGAIQSYMFGLLLEALAVAVMNCSVLLILGVDYALLIGVAGALLNLLPFIGGLIAVALPILVVTVTSDGYSTQLIILACYIVIQFIDNHFLVPYLVASKVRINALVSIIFVLLGGELWGVPGMFFAIPVIGVLKIIFDRLPELKAWGKLLGDEMPTRRVVKVKTP